MIPTQANLEKEKFHGEKNMKFFISGLFLVQKKNLGNFLTSEFSKANLTLYYPQVLLTRRSNPAGQFLDVCDPAGRFPKILILRGSFLTF